MGEDSFSIMFRMSELLGYYSQCSERTLLKRTDGSFSVTDWSWLTLRLFFESLLLSLLAATDWESPLSYSTIFWITAIAGSSIF